VQGLRGIAVLVVVIMHAGLPLPGGFTGVDIFFVISGFVITRALMKRLSADGHLRMSTFYFARIRRLLPALALMLTVVLLASMVLGAIGAMGITARTGAAAALINANTYLMLFDVGGYFDAASALNPLLHTWSLSVEEQFYVVFPTLLLLSWVGVRRFRPGAPMARVRWMLIAGTTLSFALATYLSFVVPAAAAGGLLGRIDYYSAFTRGWEFAAGGLLVVAPLAIARTRRTSTLVAASGTALIVIGLITISDSRTYPGPLTLLPVVGAVLVIAAGTSELANPVSAALSTGPMVWLGNLSYSWYLWHWPLIVFAGIWWSGAAVPRVAAAAASLGVAWLSMRFLEEPIRFRPNPSRRSTLRLATVCVCLPLVAALALGQWHATLKNDDTINPFALHLDSLLDCDSPAPLGKKPTECTWPVVGSRGRAVLVGDSLAGQYSEAFVQGMAAAGIDAEIATLSACPFMEFRGNADQAHDLGFTPDRECASFVRRTMAQLLADPPDIVFISSSAQRFLPAPAGVAPAAASDSRALPDQQWTQARATMIRRLQAAGSSVVMIDPLTKFDGWGPLTEGPFKESPAITVLLGGSRYNPQVPRSRAKTSLSRAVAAEDAAVAETGADHLQFFDVVCASSTCSARNGEDWTYRDFEHLSVATARGLSSSFRDMATRVMASRDRG
jgi:peptidoglycan/LPS O-acetylase OafA/YrhL